MNQNKNIWIKTWINSNENVMNSFWFIFFYSMWDTGLTESRIANKGDDYGDTFKSWDVRPGWIRKLKLKEKLLEMEKLKIWWVKKWKRKKNKNNKVFM